MQGELTRHIFGTFINDLKEVLDGSDQAFINNFVIVTLAGGELKLILYRCVVVTIVCVTYHGFYNSILVFSKTLEHVESAF